MAGIGSDGNGTEPNHTLDSTFNLRNEGSALIAHDAMKERMLDIAERHFALLDQFRFRCATGTNGSLLNKLAQKIKGEEAGRNWVRPFLSGPLGGDSQIAELILERQQCRRVLFLEDPHIAPQHEADIQLLERASPTVTDYAAVHQRCAMRRTLARPAATTDSIDQDVSL